MLSDAEVEDIEVDNSSVEEHISSEDRSDEDANYVDDNDVPLDDETIWKKTFDTTDEADLFFKEYGRRMGFTTRKCHTDSKNGIIKNMKWECSLAGFRKPPIGGLKSVRRSKPDTRCGCTVCFRVARENKKYKVTMFVSAHNHELQTVKTAKKAKRNISPGNQAVITMMNEVGIKTSQIMDYLKLAEGPSNLTFSNKDAHNFLAKERREFVKHGDATTALCLLDVMKLNDADLVYEKVVGEDGSVNMLFWADGLGRAQYKLFGDALVFDSTYKTNKYKFPLVILSGVDNNMRTCVFGGALIHNETFESYAWLLQTFLRLMGGQAPLSVITDQDAAMHKAIQNVFPKTKHRLCNWHLGRNCMQYVKVPEFCNEFSRLTAQKLSIDDFEETWERITKKHGVAENSWVLETYSKREMWAEAYFKGHFTAMMRSSQRAESMNTRFKVRGKQGFNLCEFLKQFFNNLHTLRLAAFEIQRESEHSVKSDNRVALRSFVDHASTVYSKNIRTEVYNEIAKEQALVLAESIELHGGVRKLTFSKFGSSKKKSWSVEIDDVNEKFYCECEKLESTGFPCCHLFSAFKQLGITTIPNACIRERWTTKIGQQLHVYFTNLFLASDSQRQRFMQLHRECVALCLDASQSASGTEDLMKQFQKAKKSLKDVVSGTSEILDRDETIGEQSKVRDPIRQSQNYGIGNPSKSKPRGAPRNRRQKCGFCRYEGHKITGCPDKKSKEEQEKKSHFTKDNEDP